MEGLTLPHEEALDEVRATAARAASEGVETLLLRVGTRHPARALLEVVREQDAGLLVLAPDPAVIGRAPCAGSRAACAGARDASSGSRPDGPVDSRRALL